MSGFLGMMFPGSSAITPSVFIAYGGATPLKRISVYGWDSTTGFGSIYTAPAIPNAISQVSFVRNNSNLSASFVSAPYFSVWQWSGVGFGTQYSNPGSALSPGGGGPAGFTWTDSIDAILTSNATAQSFPQAWAWNQTTGFGSKYSNGPALNSVGTSTGITLNGTNTQVAFSQGSSPVISLFPWSSATGFGTKYANPASLPPFGNNTGSISFNQITNDLAVGSTSSPFVASYAVSPSGFGVKYANPSTFIGGTVYSVRFAPSGAAISIGTNYTPGVKVYAWGAGFGSQFASPLFNATGQSTDWSSTTSAIAGAQTVASPYTTVWRWTPSGFGSAYSSPATAPGVPSCVSFSNQTR